MSVRGQFVAVENAGRRRVAVRRTLRLAAAGSIDQGNDVNILNLSATGMLIESPVSLAVGELLQVELPHAGATGTTIVWSSGNFFGCRFKKPLSSATMSAVLLKSEPSRPALAVDNDDTIEGPPFPIRMRQLRERCGLSHHALAQRLGVSRQTVWHWESGRNLPGQENLARLALFLGVHVQELAPGRIHPTGHTANLSTLLEARKAEIAQLAGTTQDKVRVIIEL